MEFDPIYLAKKDAIKTDLVLVRREGDPMADALVQGPQGGSFKGIRFEAQPLYANGNSPLDERGEGNITIITLQGPETMADIPDNKLDGAYVTAVTSHPLKKSGYKHLTGADKAQLNGHLAWVDGRANTILAIHPDQKSVRNDTFYAGVLAEKNSHGINVFTPSWFAARNINTRSRLVGTQEMSHLEFFIKPEREEIERLNEILTRTDEPTFFVPTCPPDPYVYRGKNTIEYTRGALTGGISWAAQNALDAVDELVPHLVRKGKQPRLVFGLGDYEFPAGYNRGMTREGFMEKTNESAEKVAARVKALLEKAYKTETSVEVEENRGGVHTIHIRVDGVERATIAGIMQLAGGEDVWETYVSHATEEVKQAAADPQLGKLRERVMQNRESMTKYWLRMKKLPVTDETRASEFALDAGYYFAFHRMIQQQLGQDTIVVAGDSRPMELFASRGTGNPLISVSGMYAGAGFDK